MSLCLVTWRHGLSEVGASVFLDRLVAGQTHWSSGFYPLSAE